jgi:hypothetical protein
VLYGLAAWVAYYERYLAGKPMVNVHQAQPTAAGEPHIYAAGSSEPDMLLKPLARAGEGNDGTVGSSPKETLGPAAKLTVRLEPDLLKPRPPRSRRNHPLTRTLPAAGDQLRTTTELGLRGYLDNLARTAGRCKHGLRFGWPSHPGRYVRPARVLASRWQLVRENQRRS